MKVTYNSDYFTELEIQDTIRNAIKKLDLEKEKVWNESNMRSWKSKFL